MPPSFKKIKNYLTVVSENSKPVTDKYHSYSAPFKSVLDPKHEVIRNHLTDVKKKKKKKLSYNQQ